MYLKALEIQGFKSFPDKTVLNFGEDITAIVGPNGSGKSNISDAIRWVMGEQNSRQLRGAKMEDVIFGGTEKRRAMGFAQVTLVIDNTEHIFNRDEAEVAVTRRYYRSGESEYYINRQSVRLKDVNELFMDTGMGREGYSIIGQGKIDEILSVRSDDRREVFEEAAGISKYRHRKEESERKLQRTEENLVRINDKIMELQVEPLRKQAETAKKYLVLRDELRTLEISVWLENLQKLKADRLKLQADFETAQADQKKAQDELDRVYAQAEECSRLLHENDCAAEEKRGRISALESAIGEHESAAAVARTTAQHHAETIERMNREMSESRSRTESLHEQMQVMARRMEEIDASARTLENEIAALCEEMRGSSDAAAAAAAQLEQLRRREAQEVAGAAQAQAELSAITAGSDEITQRTAELTEELTQSEEKLTQTRREAAQNEKELLSAREEEQAAANIIGGHSLKMEGRQRRAKESIEQKNQLSLQEKTISDRIRLLSEMEKEYEGFSKAVKIVMRAAEARTLSGIHGPVGNLIHTDKDCSVAIEIALGGALQHIVVDTKNDGKNAIGLLKQRDGGRATFLPLDTIRGRSLRENGLENEYGFVGIASELVRCDGRYGSVIGNLLGATVVVEDLDCGIQMAKRHDNRFRIVTLDGQVINAGGSMTGGSVSRNAGILSRSGELEQLHKKLKKIQSQLQDATLLAESANRELQKAQYELEVARDQQRQANDRVLTLEGRKNHYDMLIESLEQQQESLRIQKENLQKRSTDDAGRMDTIRRTIADFTARAEETREEIEMLQRRQETARQGLGEMTDRLTEKKAQQAALSAEGESARRSMEDLSRLRESLEGEHTDRESLRAQMEQAMAQARAEEERQQQEARELRGGIEEHRQALQKLSEEKMALETRRSQTDRLSRTCNDTLLNCEREVTRLEGKLNGSALEEKQILDKLWERYELSHSDAQALRVELESVPKATRRIGELNREIKGLGAINIGAIEEFDRVNTRYTYLSDQRNDVEKAKEELLGIIEEITKQMTEIFATQFEILKQSFQETFLELFGGGRATLELEDENDILRCGIEIKAQPPGKQLKTLSLLSGGEKAFVAIALYFAILKVHPTPFCVMDEIEAALDESNVVRYARYMRRIAGKTQFIVITHRRGTMEEADVLYGITMQERGVSTVLTANLNELSKEMKIK